MNIEALKASYSLEGKVAIVTGAARPNGQGLATAKILAERGAKVVLTDVGEQKPEYMAGDLGLGSAEQLEKAVAEVKALGGEAIGVPADLAKMDEFKAVVE